jgi:hypothetical protein
LWGGGLQGIAVSGAHFFPGPEPPGRGQNEIEQLRGWSLSIVLVLGGAAVWHRFMWSYDLPSSWARGGL